MDRQTDRRADDLLTIYDGITTLCRPSCSKMCLTKVKQSANLSKAFEMCTRLGAQGRHSEHSINEVITWSEWLC